MQCRGKGKKARGGGGGIIECPRRLALGEPGDMLPHKVLKSRGSEMLFPAFSKSYL